MIFDPGLFVAWCAAYLAAAVLVRRAGGRAVAYVWGLGSFDWTLRLMAARRGVRQLQRHGWSGRHGLPDGLVTAVETGLCRVPELDDICPRPATANVEMADDQTELTEAEQAEVDAMHAIVEETREEQGQETARVVEILLGATTEVGIVETDLVRRVDARFARLIAQFDNRFDGLVAELDADAEMFLVGAR